MVRHAARTVPYYQQLFRELQLNPADIRSAEDLDRLPLIDRAVVREDPSRFVSTSRWGRDAVQITTSGTSGVPLAVHHDRYSMLARVAFEERRRAAWRAILGPSGARTILTIAFRGTSADTWGAFWADNMLRPTPPHNIRLYGHEPVAEVIETINRHRPDVIASHGSYLELLFKMAAARGLDIHPPRLIAYGADSMSEEGQRAIEERLGCPILSTYGAIEAPGIGFTCEHRTGFHLNMDLVHVRLIDQDGHDVPPGQSGEVVISNLVNQAMVLLNYRLGDVAALLPQPCPCGRTLPLFSLLEGRVDDVIELPNGEMLSPRPITGALKHRQEIQRFQLVQHTLDEFELRLVTIDRAAFERVADDAVGALRRLLGQSVRITAVYCDEAELSGRERKFRPVLSRLRQREQRSSPGSSGVAR
jgi:phenylacetate-CoA ligase